MHNEEPVRRRDAPDGMHEVDASHALPLEVRGLLSSRNGNNLEIVDQYLEVARLSFTVELHFLQIAKEHAQLGIFHCAQRGNTPRLAIVTAETPSATNMLRKSVCVGLLLPLLAAVASSRALDAQNPEAESGLLIGLASGQTLWIAAQPDSSMQLSWRSPYLISPQRDGYWFVVSVERCEIDSSETREYHLPWVSRSRSIAVVRPGALATVTMQGATDCHTVESRVLAERERRYRSELARVGGDSSKVDMPRPTLTAGADFDCTTNTEDVRFLSGIAIGIEQRYGDNEYCNPGLFTGDGSNIVRRLGTQRQIRLRPLLSPRASRDLVRHANDDACGPRAQSMIDESWTPRRENGRLVVSIWRSAPNICGNGSARDFAIPLPPTFTGETALSPDVWKALKAETRGLRDASLSPSGWLLATIVSDTLVIQRMQNGRRGEVVGRLDGVSGDVVMYRWATAEEARRWTVELPQLQAPMIKVVRSQ